MDTHGPGLRIEVPAEWLERHIAAGTIDSYQGMISPHTEYVIPRELFEELNQFDSFPWNAIDELSQLFAGRVPEVLTRGLHRVSSP